MRSFESLPHGAQEIRLLEDDEDPCFRIYRVSSTNGGAGSISFLGVELESMLDWWLACERTRPTNPGMGSTPNAAPDLTRTLSPSRATTLDPAAERVAANAEGAIRLFPLSAGEYDGAIGPFDFHARREGNGWVADIFDSTVQDPELAYTASVEEESLDALLETLHARFG